MERFDPTSTTVYTRSVDKLMKLSDSSMQTLLMHVALLPLVVKKKKCLSKLISTV